MAHPFDADRLALTGDPIPVSGSTAFVGDVSFSASVDGTLLYRPQSLISELVWLDCKALAPALPRPRPGSRCRSFERREAGGIHTVGSNRQPGRVGLGSRADRSRSASRPSPR